MASYTIPEHVIPGELFVPDGHDYFSIESGGLPNGDDCLVVHGDVSTDYKAFQPAPALSPDMFRDKRVLCCMTFWIKLSAITPPGSGYRCDRTLFGVMNSSFAGDTVTGGQMGTPSTGQGARGFNNITWLVVATGATSIGIFRARNQYSFGNGGSIQAASVTIPEDTWTMVTFRLDASDGQQAKYALNDDVEYVNTTTSDFGSDIAQASNPYFCIGAYSDANPTNVTGRDGEWRLGKLAFWDHALNATERALLFKAMTEL